MIRLIKDGLTHQQQRKKSYHFLRVFLTVSRHKFFDPLKRAEGGVAKQKYEKMKIA